MLVWCALQLPVYIAGDISVLHMFSCIISGKSGLASLGSSPMKIQKNVATQKYSSPFSVAPPGGAQTLWFLDTEKQTLTGLQRLTKIAALPVVTDAPFV